MGTALGRPAGTPRLLPAPRLPPVWRDAPAFSRLADGRLCLRPAFLSARLPTALLPRLLPAPPPFLLAALPALLLPPGLPHAFSLPYIQAYSYSRRMLAPSWARLRSMCS